MKVKFLGVGEAFDEELANTSIRIRSCEGPDGRSILLDCGFTAPPPFWSSSPGPDDLDAVWISHFHADHCFGIPALLTRFRESNRKKPLLIVSQQGVEDMIAGMMALAYPSVLANLGFDLAFKTVEPGEEIKAAGFSWRTAVNGHSRRDLALRLAKDGKSLFYSGDGPANKDTLALASGAGLVIHEAFLLDRDLPGHGSILRSIAFAREAKARALALVHIHRDERRARRDEILKIAREQRDLRVFMPEPGEEVEL